MSKLRLTDRSLISGVTLNNLLHFVITGDTSQNPAGSSYKGSVEQLFHSLSSFTCDNALFIDTINACDGLITINGDVTVNGSATTINTQIIQALDNNIILNYSGTHLTAIGGGITLEDGQSDGVDSTIITDSNGTWLFNPGLSAYSGTILNFYSDSIGSPINCVNDLYISNIYGCSPITVHDTIESVTGIIRTSGGTGAELNIKDPFGPNGTWSITSDNGGYTSGSTWVYGQPNNGAQLAYQIDTYPGEAIGLGIYDGLTPLIYTGKEVVISNNINTNVFSGNIDKRAVFIATKNSQINSGLVNTVVIGGENIIASNNNTVYVPHLNINVTDSGTPISSLFLNSNRDVITGNTGLSSASCVTDLYVSNIHSCSPLNINPLDEGNVYFGSTSGVTIDVSNSRVGIGVLNPTERLVISGNTTQIGNINITGNTTHIGIVTHSGDTFITGNTTQLGNINLTGSSTHIGILTHSGDTFVTGNTTQYGNVYISGTSLPNECALEVDGNVCIDGDVNITGDTILQDLTANTLSVTTINTPLDCVDDLYVSNIHSCSPLNINPLDEGNVYFGSSSGVTIDVSNSRLGIGTSSPSFPLDVKDSNSIFRFNPSSAGGLVLISGATNIPRMGVNIPAYLTKPIAGGAIGMRSWDDTIYTAYGKVGDFFVRAANETNGLNLINTPGSSTEDYIRFYAGTLPTGTADLHIQGSGSTRGNIGIGTETPSKKLTVSGDTLINGSLYVGLPQKTAILTTAKMSPPIGQTIVYSLPVSDYTGAWFDYTVKNGTNARAGQIMSVFDGVNVKYAETSTTDIGTTSPISFSVTSDGSNASLVVSATTSGWEVKTIIRSI